MTSQHSVLLSLSLLSSLCVQVLRMRQMQFWPIYLCIFVKYTVSIWPFVGCGRLYGAGHCIASSHKSSSQKAPLIIIFFHSFVRSLSLFPSSQEERCANGRKDSGIRKSQYYKFLGAECWLKHWLQVLFMADCGWMPKVKKVISHSFILLGRSAATHAHAWPQDKK